MPTKRYQVLCTVLAVGALISLLSINSCSTLNALTGLTRLEFKLQDAKEVSLAGVNLMGKKSIKDVSIMDGINISKAFASGKFPLTFTLNVAAKNPNAKDPNNTLQAISLTNFPWRLLIDGKETISGGIGAPVSVPNGGATEIIPLQVSVDLKKFFAEKSYEEMANLAMALAGGGTAHLQLNAQPTISTPLGSMKYPKEVQIVNTEFRN
jgi:hypothetical protein